MKYHININQIFDTAIKIVFTLILLVLIFAMVIGAVKMLLNVWNILSTPAVSGEYTNLITDLLTLFVLVEMSRSLADYFHTSRLRMVFLVDAAIVFFIREIMILVFQHKASDGEIYAFSCLLLVLTTLRVGSIFMFQRELKMVIPQSKSAEHI
jgi:uncharacterized membrane protein (DUF373 family)